MSTTHLWGPHGEQVGEVEVINPLVPTVLGTQTTSKTSQPESIVRVGWVYDQRRRLTPRPVPRMLLTTYLDGVRYYVGDVLYLPCNQDLVLKILRPGCKYEGNQPPDGLLMSLNIRVCTLEGSDRQNYWSYKVGRDLTYLGNNLKITSQFILHSGIKWNYGTGTLLKSTTCGLVSNNLFQDPKALRDYPTATLPWLLPNDWGQSLHWVGRQCWGYGANYLFIEDSTHGQMCEGNLR